MRSYRSCRSGGPTAQSRGIARPRLSASLRTNPFCHVLSARLPVLAVLASLILAGPCAAQSAPPRTQSTTLQARSTNALGLWVGGSLSNGGLIGNIRRAHVGLVGLRYHRLLTPPPAHGRSSGPSLTYTADVIPVLFLSIPAEAIPTPPPTAPPSTPPESLTAWGIGVRPAGLRLTFRSAKRAQPFIAGSTGWAHFTRSVPSAQGKSLNFMFDVGAGVRVVVTPALVLTVGYRYHHLSNGFRGQINPGVDANLVQLGVTVTP